MKFTFNPFDLDDEELSSIVHKRLRLDEREEQPNTAMIINTATVETTTL